MSTEPFFNQPTRVLTVSQIRQVDAIAILDFGMNSLVLMENAGRGCADFIDNRLNRSSGVTILVGPGNNGGDGLVIARHLHAMGHRVHVWMVAQRGKLSVDAEANLKIVERTKVPIGWIGESQSAPELERTWNQLRSDLATSQMVIDALLGTGATGKPRVLMADVVRLANQGVVQRVAIDIPTGLDAETGQPSDPTFHAEFTLTFVAKKPGFLESCAAECLGEVRILSIGVPPEVFDHI